MHKIRLHGIYSMSTCRIAPSRRLFLAQIIVFAYNMSPLFHSLALGHSEHELFVYLFEHISLFEFEVRVDNSL